MARIYINYSEEEFELICAKSKEIGLSPTAFVKYNSLLGLSYQNSYDLIEIMNKMHVNLKEMKSGTKFIVSALVPHEWVQLTRGEKMTLSKKLAAFVKEHPYEFERVGKLKDKTTQYIKL